MPGPVIPNPTPEWLKPENASVTDTALTKAMRMIGHLIGADNPTAQVLGLMMTDVPGGSATGGLAKAVEGLKARVIKAYHGSPHDFERFSLEKIGTGEGAQAYGHGLYFAENPAVAADYRDTLSYLSDDESRQILDMLPKPFQGPDNVRGIVANIRKAVNAGEVAKPSHFARDYEVGPQLQQAYKKAGEILDNKGKMYEVAIHADPEDFLDWDKPLSQQSEKVKQAVRDIAPMEKFHDGMQLVGGGTLRIESDPDFGDKFFMEMGGKKFKLNPGDVRNLVGSGYEGKSVYQALSSSLGGDAAASSELKKRGVPGIRYLDQGSRSSGQGTYNYMVTDDRLIDILKKYGLLLPAAGGVSQATISRRSE